jgi:DNA-directed RNA polymerase subunit omega
MARITVEDCLEKIPNRFTLVLVTVERTKQLMKGARPMVEDDQSNKEIVMALREIAARGFTAEMTSFDENENARSQLRNRMVDLPEELLATSVEDSGLF